MSFLSKIKRLLPAGDREGDDLQPRAGQAPLPAIEQFERRFCLGMVAAAAVAEWSSQATSAPVADEMVLWNRAATAPPPEAPAPCAAQKLTAGNEAGNSTNAVPKSSPAMPAPVSQSPEVNPASFTSPDISSPLVSAADSVGDSSSTASTAMIESSTNAAPLAGPRVARSQAKSESDGSGAESQTPAAEYGLSSNGSSGASVAAISSIANDIHAQSISTSSDNSLSPQAISVAAAQLDTDDVQLLLKRAAAATSSNDAIIAVVDRNGRILGVRMEDGVLAAIPDDATRVFAIDGAVAKARTAAMFSSGQLDVGTVGPLTSRTVRFISQSTVTEREVESNPNVDGATAATAAASTVRGPGFVAPIGVGGHFPPEIANAPLVDLFAIEHTNRDSNDHPGADGVRGTADDIVLRTGVDGTGRFNIDPLYVPADQGLFAPESYGAVQNSGLLPDAQSRGIATLPGGIPLYRDTDGDGFGDTLVGGIGVFFPGADGYATHEQGFVPGIGQTEAERTNAPKVLEAEYIAFAAAGGSANARIGNIAGIPPVAGLDLPSARIDLVGVTLQSIGPVAGKTGLMQVVQQGQALGEGTINGADQPLIGGVDGLYRAGKVVPTGWLVMPHNSTDGGLTGAQVNSLIQQGIAAAEQTRAAIRGPFGARTEMTFAVTDTNGEVLGLYRMEDATTFSIDVAVAKARNVAYYSDAADLQPVDQVPGIAAGTAFTNRTFRFLAQPRYPSGIDGTPPPEFSILNDDAIGNLTAENEGAPAPVSAFNSVFGHDAFFPMTNFHDPGDASVVAAAGTNQNVANQNGVVFFPGSTPVYVNGQIRGGFGVSGDGVDQDDVVTYLGARGFLPTSTIVRADQTFYRDVRLPYQKFLRNPFG